MKSGQALSAETRRRLSEHDPRWPIKAALRVICIPFAFLAMLMFAISVSLTNKHFYSYYGEGDWTDGMCLAPILISLLINPIILVVLFVVRRGKAIHPGWFVGIDLIIWLLTIPCLVFAIGDGWFMYWSEAQEDEYGLIECDTRTYFGVLNYWSKECHPIIYKIGHMEIAGIVFLFILLILHFTLFVFACIATKKWRAEAKRTIGERRNIELQYHRDPEEHAVHSPPAYTPKESIPSPTSPRFPEPVVKYS